VLGANDGIISISCLAIGVATASTTRDPVILATVAGLVAGALSMAAGEYVSVSSQTDIEMADIKREEQELKDMPENELNILAEIYEKRGLKKDTAMQVAIQLTEADALAAHVRDELGINEISQAKPIQAALASAAAFTTGGLLPLLVALFSPVIKYGVFPLRIYNNFPGDPGNSFSKNRWIQCNEGNCKNRYLGNCCNGFVCGRWISVWSKGVISDHRRQNVLYYRIVYYLIIISVIVLLCIADFCHLD
jgi:hypothetical protein